MSFFTPLNEILSPLDRNPIKNLSVVLIKIVPIFVEAIWQPPIT